MKTLLSVSFCLLAIAGFSNQTFSQCRPMMQDRIDSVRNNRLVGFKLTSNRADGRYVSYSEGSLKGERASGEPDNSPNIVGLKPSTAGRQLFSDRKYTLGNLANCTLLQTNRNVPFSIFSTDAIDVEVLRNPVDGGNTVLVNMTLSSWGGGVESFTGTCHDNLIFGFVDSTQTIFTLSLFDIRP